MSLLGRAVRLGHTIVSWGLGGRSERDNSIATIQRPAPVVAYSIEIPSAVPAYTISIPSVILPHANKIHVGDTVVIRPIIVRDIDDVIVDPDSFTVLVKPDNATSFSLVWGTAPSTGNADAVIRTAVGTFTVQIEITTARGAGTYAYTVVTTGAVAAEPGIFTVSSRVV